MEVLASARPGKTSPGDSEGMLTVGVGCGRALGAGKEVVSLSLFKKCPQGQVMLGKAEHLSSGKGSWTQDSCDRGKVGP